MAMAKSEGVSRVRTELSILMMLSEMRTAVIIDTFIYVCIEGFTLSLAYQFVYTGGEVNIMARRTREEAEQTRQALLDAALRVFSAKGVAHSSLADVAQEAGLTRGAIYWHFSNKTELFHAMHERVQLPFEFLMEYLGQHQDQLSCCQLRQVCYDSLARVVHELHCRTVLEILLQKCEFTEEMEPVRERLVTLCEPLPRQLSYTFQVLAAQGLLRQGVEPEIAAHGLTLYLHGIVSGWLFNPEKFDLANHAPALINLLLDGLLLDDSVPNPTATTVVHSDVAVPR